MGGKLNMYPGVQGNTFYNKSFELPTENKLPLKKKMSKFETRNRHMVSY